MAMNAQLDTLVKLSRALGHPSRDMVILAEGNTSIRTSDDRMLVKASGAQLGTAVAEDFVEVEIAAMLELVDGGDDDDVERVFGAVSRAGKRPSVEAMLHAVCLSTGGASVVGHTHPVPVNILLCSSHAERLASEVLFPEQVVVLGPQPIALPYLDPGLTLARAVRLEIAAYLREHARPPKVIYLGNHGIVALGQSATEVVQISEMAVKVSRILGGVLAIGQLRSLPPGAVQRIDLRPDEAYRRQALANPTQPGEPPSAGPHD
jgi:rhamnose utilization protein RhaD (predicted bifunctional aldolase and dehydrogenase)